MVDLHAAIVAELDRREAVARHAQDGPWARDATNDSVYAMWTLIRVHIADVDTNRSAVHIAVHDPVDALRRYTAARRVLDRHPRYVIPDGYGTNSRKANCARCNGMEWPCAEVIDVAESLGITVSPSGTEGEPHGQ